MTNFNFTPKTKNDIFNLVINQNDPFGEQITKNGIITFLLKIWDLRSMPSEDSRYRNAYEDAIQHTVNNADWDYNYIFYERFNIFEDNNIFKKFIEALVHPEIRITKENIEQYFYLLNPILKQNDLSLIIIDIDELELPIYKINIEDGSELPVDFKKNTIPFFVDYNPTGKSHFYSSHKKPTTFPSLVLVHNKDWNDYKLFSKYSLFYYESETDIHLIGPIKIVNIDGDSTNSNLESKFTHLGNLFCSLGQSVDFYYKLQSHLKLEFKSILWALKDAAFFSNIQEEFENEWGFKNSLVRYDEEEKLLREIKYLIYGYNLSSLYKFNYSFKPKFSKTPLEIQFDFENENIYSNRVYALIGKNGTGKTQLITSLPIDLYKKNDEQFTPKAPLFSKVIAVSYSAFDSFEIPKKTTSFNYLYCGLIDENGDRITDRSLVLRFHNSWKKIKSVGRMEKWVKILDNFIEEELINQFIKYNESKFEYEVDLNGFRKTRKIFSSGQSIILYIITEIVANIRYDSLILYDEPETHLHPNAISQLMNTIFELVREFKSYCIVATHSPLIIRELLSKNVFVIEREGEYASIKKLAIETFGENLTVLTEEVFGNRAIPKRYKKIIKQMLNTGYTIEQITNEIESEGLPMSLNTSIYLNNLVNEKS